MATFLIVTVMWIIPSELGMQFSLENKLRLVLIIFLITAVLPVLSLFIMKLTNGISSFTMEARQDRVVPFIFIAVYYALAAYLLTSKISLGSLFDTLILTVSFLVILSALITAFWKVSIHSLATAGILGFLIGMNYNSPDSLFYWPIFYWFLITGFTMSSRLYLNAHQPSEVWGGAMLGFILCFLSILIFV